MIVVIQAYERAEEELQHTAQQWNKLTILVRACFIASGTPPRHLEGQVTIQSSNAQAEDAWSRLRRPKGTKMFSERPRSLDSVKARFLFTFHRGSGAVGTCTLALYKVMNLADSNIVLVGLLGAIPLYDRNFHSGLLYTIKNYNFSHGMRHRVSCLCSRRRRLQGEKRS